MCRPFWCAFVNFVEAGLCFCLRVYSYDLGTGLTIAVCGIGCSAGEWFMWARHAHRNSGGGVVICAAEW
jgi:hypothetical protein